MNTQEAKSEELKDKNQIKNLILGSRRSYQDNQREYIYNERKKTVNYL